MLTADRARELLAYEPETGLLRWKVDRRGHSRAGDIAGTEIHGYIVVGLDCRAYPAHRLAWLIANGAWPCQDIDHIDGDRKNNRLANLRDVSRVVNLQNRRGAGPRSTSGLLGVKRNHKNWSAAITVNGITKHLGTFKTPAEAHQSYLAAKRQLHEGNTL